MFLLRGTLLVAFCGVCVFAQEHTKPLSGPTYYVAARVFDCSPNEIEVRGATNLPTRAVLDIQITRFFRNAWKDYSDPVRTSVDNNGFFSATMRSKPTLRFYNNLVARVTFSPYLHAQPTEVLKVVGNRGEKLGNWNNPQLGQVSGQNYYVETIARVEACGGTIIEGLPD